MLVYNPDYHELWCRKTSHLLDRQTVPLLYHPLVENVFIVSNTDRVASPTVILPDVSPHFIIYVYEHKPPRFRMIGPRSKAVYLTHTYRSQTIIFRFRPAVVSTIINSPISKWMDISTDISEAFVEFF
ncbi:MAG: DUF6597 domain-containing transcriptional factor [Bacteroidota bacterium]